MLLNNLVLSRDFPLEINTCRIQFFCLLMYGLTRYSGPDFVLYFKYWHFQWINIGLKYTDNETKTKSICERFKFKHTLLRKTDNSRLIFVKCSSVSVKLLQTDASTQKNTTYMQGDSEH